MIPFSAKSASSISSVFPSAALPGAGSVGSAIEVKQNKNAIPEEEGGGARRVSRVYSCPPAGARRALAFTFEETETRTGPSGSASDRQLHVRGAPVARCAGLDARPDPAARPVTAQTGSVVPLGAVGLLALSSQDTRRDRAIVNRDSKAEVKVNVWRSCGHVACCCLGVILCNIAAVVNVFYYVS